MARQEEAEALSVLAIRSKAAWGYDQAFMQACRDELGVSAREIARDLVYLACDPDGAIHGFYHLQIAGEVADVDALFIEPGSMRQGVGRRLWQHLETQARAGGASRLVVESDPHAADFYRAMGMADAGSVPSGSIPGRRLPFLTKDL